MCRSRSVASSPHYLSTVLSEAAAVVYWTQVRAGDRERGWERKRVGRVCPGRCEGGETQEERG